jgi:PST family polysaccharide transporter
MNDTLKLAKANTFWSLITVLSKVVSGFLISIIIARAPGISVEQVGQIMFAISLAIVASLFVDYGLDTYFIKETGKKTLRENALSGLVGFRLAISIAVMLILSLVVTFLDLSRQEKLLTILITAAYLVSVLNRSYLAYFQSQHLFGIETKILFFGDVLLLTMLLAALYIGDNTLYVGIAYLCSRLCSLFLSFYYISREKIKWLPTFILPLYISYAKGSFSFALLAILATTSIYIDTLLLRFLAPETPERQVAFYQIAMQFVMAATLIPTILGKSLLPILSSGNDQHNTYLRVNNVLMTLGVLVSIFVIINSQSLIIFVYGEKYLPVSQILQLLGFVIMMRFGMMYNLYLTIRGNNWYRVLGSFCMLTTSAICSFLLVPALGSVGSALSSILAHFAIWSVYLYALYRSNESILLGWNILQAMIFSMSFFIIMWSTKNLPLLFTIPLAIVSAILIMYFSLSKSDRHLLSYKLLRA